MIELIGFKHVARDFFKTQGDIIIVFLNIKLKFIKLENTDSSKETIDVTFLLPVF